MIGVIVKSLDVAAGIRSSGRQECEREVARCAVISRRAKFALLCQPFQAETRKTDPVSFAALVTGFVKTSNRIVGQHDQR